VSGEDASSPTIPQKHQDKKMFENRKNLNTYEKLWSLMDQYIGHDKESI